MYLEKFEKFGIKQFLFDIFSSQTSIINQVLSQVPQSQADDYISFTQIDNLIEESLQFDPPPTTDFLGFQTGKGKKIEIDNKEIEKALKLFDDKEDIKIDKIFFEPNKNNNNNNNLQKSIRNSNILYGSTQNNKVNSFGLKEIKETDEKILDHEKNCSISKEISSSTFSIFPILKEAKETGYLETSNEKQLDNMNFPGFQTARGNIMKIDEKKLKNAERLFNEEEKPKLGFIHTEFEAFSGFQTAKGASIEINAKKLNEAEEFFKEKENPLQMKKIERKSSFNPTKLEAFSGFQTAKGTSIEINERKLNEAENLFKEKENHFQGKENYRKKPEKNLLFPKKKTPETLLLHNNKKEKPENSIIYNNKQVNPENLLLSNNKKNFETRNFEKLSIKKTPSKTLFLDFKNKKKKIENQKEMENNQFLLNKADSGISHSKIFTKSSEKLKISKPTSKRIVSEQSQKFSFFNNKKPEIYIKKRSFEDFIEENKMIVSPQICQKPSTKQKKSDKINEILTKSPNLIFNLETKGILSLMNKSKTPIKLTSLSIIPVLNANKEFEINETSAGNFNFICECMNLSQINTEKCLCKGKFLINFDWFHKFLEEKFEKMNITQGWVKHHYRLIIWKLASYSKHIQPLPINKILNLENVLSELEKRTLLENKGKRSIIKKIIEKDEMLGKHLVLLIGKIVYIPEQKFYVVELSDGWYSIFFVIFNNAKENSKNVFYSNNNALFLDLIHKKMLFSGLKLHLVGLEKAPYQNLVSFFNFETFESEKIIVNVCYNNVSRAKWNEKLGLKKERFFLKNLNSLRPCGGFVSLIDVFVIKKYPLLEKKGNKISYLRDNSEGTQIKTCIFFKICVIDSLLFESKGNSTSNSSLCQKNYVEIGFFYTSIELYEHIQEGDRLRITNLKAEDRDKVLKKRFDFITNEIVERKVYLEMSKFSKITFYNELKRNSLERKTVSCFGKEISHKMRKSISNICSNNEIVNKFKKEKIENKKLNNELDCMIYVISLDFINKDVITGRDAKNNEIRMKIHDKEFFSGKITETFKGKIVLFLNVALDTFTTHFSLGKKNQKKTIMVLTTENTKIITNNLKTSDFYKEEFEILNAKFFGKSPMSQIDLEKLFKEIEEEEES